MESKKRAVSWPWTPHSVVHMVIHESSEEPISEQNCKFLQGLRPIVSTGRLLSALSRGDVLNSKQESHRKTFILSFICALLSTFFCVNAILLLRANLARFQVDKTESEKFREFKLPSYAFTMCFVYSYQLFATKQFRNIVKCFLEVNRVTKILPRFPETFPRFCWITLFFCMTCGVAENLIYDIQTYKKADSLESTLKRYHVSIFYHWSDVIPYHPIFTVLLTILIKLGTWGWVYMDILAIVLCHAVTQKFQLLNNQVSNLVMIHSRKKQEKAEKVGQLDWESIWTEYLLICELVGEIEKFVGPLILACYGANMYIIVINLLTWIAPSSQLSPEQSYYVYFAFLQFLFRVTSVTYFAAEVHQQGNSILGGIQHCPNSLYCLSLERLERTFMCNPTGISLFGSFMITRKFFISIISFIFTTEIVLLQTAGKTVSTS